MCLDWTLRMETFHILYHSSEAGSSKSILLTRVWSFRGTCLLNSQMLKINHQPFKAINFHQEVALMACEMQISLKKSVIVYRLMIDSWQITYSVDCYVMPHNSFLNTNYLCIYWSNSLIWPHECTCLIVSFELCTSNRSCVISG